LLLQLLQSHALLAACAGLVVSLVGLQALSSDTQFRKDLRGSATLFLAYLVLRTVDIYEGERLPDGLHKTLELAWMLALVFGFIRLTVALVLKVVRSRSRPAPKILRDVLDVTLYVVATLVVVQREFDLNLSSLLAGSAIISVVIGLALQETLGNLFAGLAIQLERPFQVGDTIAVGEQVFGRIVQIGWRATRVENKRREIISLPNTTFSKQGVRNFSRGDSVGVDTFIGLSYETPPNRVKGIIRQTLAEVPLILAEPWAKVRVVAYEESHIKYRVRFYVADIRRASSVRDDVLVASGTGSAAGGSRFPAQRMVHVGSGTRPERSFRFPSGRRCWRTWSCSGSSARPSGNRWRTRWSPAGSAGERRSSPRATRGRPSTSSARDRCRSSPGAAWR
jgi:small-conductance mechanosensitive channel